MPGEEMKVKVSFSGTAIVFALNGSSVSRSFWEQLPMTVGVENYGGNEKIFQAPRKLDTGSPVEGPCPAGSIAYFSPWNNVCMYYGDAPRYPGLYVMGRAVSGAGEIGRITGTITIERAD